MSRLPALEPRGQREEAKHPRDPDHWLLFRYSPAALFSLKASRATSTAGITLLIPTPYAVKMAFLDAALRNGLADDPNALVRELALVQLQVGVPEHACVTGTIQRVRQETRDVERKRNPKAPPYRASIAMREFVSYQGDLQLAFDLQTCSQVLAERLVQIAPAINYLGKRGSFVQYRGSTRQFELDATFARPADNPEVEQSAAGYRTVLDDFGVKASFEALNSFSPTEVQRGVHRKFVEAVVPLTVYNAGPGFVHYHAGGAML